MPEQSIIVWDLETVPDFAAAARMLGMTGRAEEEVREAIEASFPKHPLHKNRMGARGARLNPTNVQGARFKLNLIPTQVDYLGR
jgi:hypothetical protein